MPAEEGYTWEINPYFEYLFSDEDTEEIFIPGNVFLLPGEGTAAAAVGTAAVYSDIESAADAVLQGVMRHQETVTLRFTRGGEDATDKDTINRIVTRFKEKCAEAYMEEWWGMGYSYGSSPYNVVFYYFDSAEESGALDAAIRSKLTELGTAGRSDHDKALLIYRFLIDHLTYDFSMVSDVARYREAGGAYDAFFTGSTVCNGYALLFCKMARAAGLEAHFHAGKAMGMNHAWNSVKIDGVYYLLDATWDDVQGNHTPDSFRYFLRGTQAFGGEHTLPTGLSYTFSSTDYGAQTGGMNGWLRFESKDYWYEDGIRQGTAYDPKGVIGDGTIRGREIYDPVSDGWYWLDSIYDGAKAVGKEVWMPYVYQGEEKWSADEIRRNANASNDCSSIGAKENAQMSALVEDAIVNKKGKWVRYDENGRMLKGWVKIEGALASYYPDQAGNTYYYDYKTGLMAKGKVTIDGKTYNFDPVTGVLKK